MESNDAEGMGSGGIAPRKPRNHAALGRMRRQVRALKIAHIQSKRGRFVGDPTEANLEIDLAARHRTHEIVAVHLLADAFKPTSLTQPRPAPREAVQRPTDGPAGPLPGTWCGDIMRCCSSCIRLYVSRVIRSVARPS